MSTEAAQRHAELTEQLIQARGARALSDEQDTALCDELATLWQQMTEDERAKADTRLMWTPEDIERVHQEAARFDQLFKDERGRDSEDSVSRRQRRQEGR